MIQFPGPYLRSRTIPRSNSAIHSRGETDFLAQLRFHGILSRARSRLCSLTALRGAKPGQRVRGISSGRGILLKCRMVLKFRKLILNRLETTDQFLFCVIEGGFVGAFFNAVV